ncbi:MAG: class I SAM-dependent RNA methyltransferase [Pseudomonadota bacterium]
MGADDFEIFLTVQPGLEVALAEEAHESGFAVAGSVAGGVLLSGGWSEVWRANLSLRGAGRVLVRVAQFRAMHLAQLDKRARKIDWGAVLRKDVAVKVEATCRASKIYHNKAAAQRVARAITEELGAPVEAKAALRVMVRIEDDLCTISLDTSGAPLHQRGLKQAVSKAPMRETLAALFLRQCGYTPGERLVDPMCGSGTFVLEAAERTVGLLPGRARSFAFESLASFDVGRWADMKKGTANSQDDVIGFGSDRDLGAIQFATANAERAGVGALCTFRSAPVTSATPPDGPPGLVMVNPPYGTRIGNKKLLYGLYAAFGDTMRASFQGWRIGLVTSDAGLARATDLPFDPPGPYIDHGGVKIRLYQTARIK